MKVRDYQQGDVVVFDDLGLERQGVVERFDTLPAKDGGTLNYVVVRPCVGTELSQSRYMFRVDSDALRPGAR